MRIQTKLFLIILCSSVVLVLGMYGLTQWTVDKGLLKYVNTREQQANQQIIRQLAEGYETHGSWRFLKENPRLLGWLAQNADPEGAPPLPDSERTPRGRFEPPPRFPQGDRYRRPPPPPSPRQQADLPVAPRAALAVLDAGKQLIVGRYDPNNNDTELSPITLAQSDTPIGWFAFTPPKRLSEDFDLALAEELQTGFLSISALMLVLSAALALPLSYLLLKRIKQLAAATRTVAKGDFSQRVSIGSNDELGQLGRDFNELAQTLQANETSRKRWFADISHELRTPLAVASGELEAMIDGVRPATPENLQSAHDEIRHLNRLINDLYELSSADIGALKYHKSNVDFRTLVEQEVHTLESTAAANGLEVALHLGATPATLRADPHRLKQLLRNLLGNALKYTDAPGKIAVTLSVEGDTVQLLIEDSAPGVAAAHMARLFDPLYRVDSSRNRKTGGSGLGLGICKQIVAGHNGSLRASSSALGGLCITVELPLAGH